MEKKKLKLSISGSSKKTFSSIEEAKSKSKNTVVIEKKSSKFSGKSKDVKTTVRIYADFQKLTPDFFKMSVSIKSKTSSSLPPYRSTEPKKLCSTIHFHYSRARRALLAVQRWLRNFQFQSIIFIIFLAFPAHL